MSTSRHLVSDPDDMQVAASQYRTILSWAADRGTRFVLRVDPQVYDDPAAFRSLCELGVERTVAADTVEVTGVPDGTFRNELTRRAAPRRAVSGDLTPSEGVQILRDDRVLYASYDYGRTQILQLTPDELADLRTALARAGLEPACIGLAPPYVTDDPK